MSLASRIANISTQGQFAPSDSHDSESTFAIEERLDTKNTSLRKGKRKEYVQIMEEEEEDRPPYLHVRQTLQHRPNPWIYQGLTVSEVDDMWCHRWYYWRSSHALYRYSENSPTG